MNSNMETLLNFIQKNIPSTRLKTIISEAPQHLPIDNTNKRHLFIANMDDDEISTLINWFPFPNFHYDKTIDESDIPKIKKKSNNEDIKILVGSYEKKQNLIQKLIKNGFNNHQIIYYQKNKSGVPNITFHFGDNNANKSCLVMIPNGSTGLLWHLNAVLGVNTTQYDYCSVDMQNYRNNYVAEGLLGIYNPWRYCFNVCTDPLNFIYESANVSFTQLTLNNNTVAIDYNIFSSTIIDAVNEQRNALFPTGKKIIGVFLRGTDYKNALWHQKPLESFEAIKIVSQYMNYYGFDYIFLNTEDLNNYEDFHYYFNDKLLALNRNRYIDDGTGIFLPSILNKEGNFSALVSAKDYLVETLLTTYTDHILSTEGSSSYVMESLLHGSGRHFERILIKGINGICGVNPLTIVNTGPNLLRLPTQSLTINGVSIELNPHGIRIKGTISRPLTLFDSHISLIKGKKVIINTYENNTTSLSASYSFTFIGKKNEHHTLTLHQSEQYTPQFDVVNIRIAINANGYVDLITQLSITTSLHKQFQPYFETHTELALTNNDGVFFNPELVDCVNMEGEFFTVCGHIIHFQQDSINRYNNRITYNEGTTYYYINGKNIPSTTHLRYTTCKEEDLPPQFFDLQSISFFIEHGCSKLFIPTLSLMLRSNNSSCRQFVENLTIDKNTLYLHNFKLWSQRNPHSAFNEDAYRWFSNIKNPHTVLNYAEVYGLLENQHISHDDRQTIMSIICSGGTPAYRHISRAYYTGDRVPIDIYKSAEWMRKAAEMGDSRSKNELFDILWSMNTPESFAEMIPLAERHAAEGDGEAMMRLGRAYRDGKGVPKDLDKAAEWMRKAVDAHIAWAKNELFDILWSMNTPESFAEMIPLIKGHADTGDGNAMGRLGRAYRDGKGVPKDLDKAAEWMRKAVDAGVTWAPRELTTITENTNQ